MAGIRYYLQPCVLQRGCHFFGLVRRYYRVVGASDYERWLASALLGVTFPFLIFYAEFYKMWPLVGQPKPAAKAGSAAA